MLFWIITLYILVGVGFFVYFAPFNLRGNFEWILLTTVILLLAWPWVLIIEIITRNNGK